MKTDKEQNPNITHKQKKFWKTQVLIASYISLKCESVNMLIFNFFCLVGNFGLLFQNYNYSIFDLFPIFRGRCPR